MNWRSVVIIGVQTAHGPAARPTARPFGTAMGGTARPAACPGRHGTKGRAGHGPPAWPMTRPWHGTIGTAAQCRHGHTSPPLLASPPPDRLPRLASSPRAPPPRLLLPARGRISFASARIFSASPPLLSSPLLSPHVTTSPPPRLLSSPRTPPHLLRLAMRCLLLDSSADGGGGSGGPWSTRGSAAPPLSPASEAERGRDGSRASGRRHL
jgi:hypothetical protein